MPLLELLQQDISEFIAAHPETAPLLKRVSLFLEDGEFTQADAYCEKVLDADPENTLAYLGKLMAARRIQSLQDLMGAQYPIDDDQAFKKAVRFAPEALKAHLLALNTHICNNCIAACRSRARVHLAHGELKETAQQYHTAVQLWEAAKDALPDADALYSDMADEIADFNWKLMLHNRQCPDNAQLISRGIPVNNDRRYCSAVQWAGDEKRSAFEAVARQVLFSAHRNCLESIASGQNKLAAIWASHYKASVPEDDPLCSIHEALLSTDGYTRYAPDAATALLALISHYVSVYPEGVAPTKALLQTYYERLFRSGLTFAEEAPSAQPLPVSYEDYIASKEQLSCSGGTASAPAPAAPLPVAPEMTPAFAMDAARTVTEQLAQAACDATEPCSLLSIYLIAAKTLTVRYGRRSVLVTTPGLFSFVCHYYENAIANAQPEQAAALQEKFNDFLLEAVRLEGASAEIAQKASSYLDGSSLPYQIYLSRLSGDYSVEKELLIPTPLTEELAKWQTLIQNANPKKDCYWLSSQGIDIVCCFAKVEDAVAACREYTAVLQSKLLVSYEDVMMRAEDCQDTLTSGWDQKMQLLQTQCNQWADALEGTLKETKAIYDTKLLAANKRIRRNAGMQLAGIILAGLGMLAVVAAFVAALIPSTGLGWLTAQDPSSASRYPFTWFTTITIAVPALACIYSLLQGLTLPRLTSRKSLRSLWLRIPAAVLVYIIMGVFAVMVVRDPNLADILAQIKDYAIAGGILLVCAIARTLLDAYFCRMPARTLSRSANIAAKICFVAAGILYLAQAIACLFIAGLFIYAAIAA